jgi:ABC-type antimicrobial peptide transport system permease subunit
MFKNYFKVTWRNLFRNKSFSLINITGLATGMASAVLILLWIQNELSYDLFHEKKDRIYQLYNRAEYEGKLECWENVPQVLGPTLKSDYPQVEEAVRVNWVGAFVFHAGDKHLETQGYITDPAFLRVFNFPLVKGDSRTALNGPNSLVLTEKMAHKLFGTADVIGKVVRVDTSALFTVTGVVKDLPNNTRFSFEYLIPWSYMKTVRWDRDSWKENAIETFVLLKPGVTEKTANERFRNVVQLHAADAKNEIFVHPLRKWRLYSRFENGKVAGGFIETVRLFGIIAAFILLIACINYMNLSTARSEKRAREVGIRKVAGAGRGLLVGQFIGESILIAFLAGIIALGIVQLSIGRFGEITWKTLYVPYTSPYFWLCSAGFILFTGIIAGSYPAFFLSAHKPISVLKGSFKPARALVTPRKVLVVLQFSFAIILIISTIVIYRQIRYAQNRDSGYEKDQLAFVFAKGDMLQHYRSIQEDLISSGAVTAVTRTSSPITSIWNDDSYTWAGKAADGNGGCIKVHADSEFAGTMGLKIVAGRDLDLKTYPTDSGAILLNESAVKLMGFKDPIGQAVKSGEGDWHVVGVVKDFILGSPYQPVQPMVIQGPGRHSWFGTVTFKLNGKNTTAGNLKKIEAIFKKYNPDYPFMYYFADDAYAQKFDYERRTAVLASLFAGLTIFISCLGLFALAAYMAENRIKEIGVRKVLGASVAGITALLSVDFLKLVIISFMVASPVAWWCMHTWLQRFTYRVSLNWWIFVLTGLLTVLIAIATISYQAIRAALTNPVKSLKAE